MAPTSSQRAGKPGADDRSSSPPHPQTPYIIHQCITIPTASYYNHHHRRRRYYHYSARGCERAQVNTLELLKSRLLPFDAAATAAAATLLLIYPEQFQLVNVGSPPTHGHRHRMHGCGAACGGGGGACVALFLIWAALARAGCNFPSSQPPSRRWCTRARVWNLSQSAPPPRGSRFRWLVCFHI